MAMLQFEAENGQINFEAISMGICFRGPSRKDTCAHGHAHTHKHAGTQFLCLATSIEQVSLVMHHRALGSRHLRTEGGGESRGKS